MVNDGLERTVARYLAIDWDRNRLRVVAVSVRRGQAVVDRAIAWYDVASPTPATAEEAGAQLRRLLRDARLPTAPVVWVVGRERCLLRDTLYPQVPAAEEPAIVRYQAGKDLSFPIEEAVVDYTPIHVPGPHGEKRALAFILHADLLRAIRSTCQTAGVKLGGVGVRPIGTAIATRPADVSADDATVRTVVLGPPAPGEFCVVRGKDLLFSRALVPPNGEDVPTASWLEAELRRSLAAYDSQFPDAPVTRLLVAEDDAAATAAGAAVDLDVDHFRVPIAKSVIEPANEPAWAFAGAVGLLQHWVHNKKLPVDFLQPKKPAPPTGRRRKVLAGLAAVVLIAATVGTWYGVGTHKRTKQIEELQQSKSLVERRIAAFGDTAKRIQAIRDWHKYDVALLDELYELIAHFPDRSGIRITRFTWTPVQPPPARRTIRTRSRRLTRNKTRIEPIARVVIEATGDSNAALESLRQRLASLSHWSLEQWERDTPEPSQIRATFRVYRLEPEEYRTVLRVSSNRAVSPRRGSDSRSPFDRGGRP